MRLFKLVVLTLVLAAAGTACAEKAVAQPPAPAPLSAIGDDSTVVDWWFIYKFPKNITPAAGANAPKSQGDEYLYFDNRSSALARSRLTVENPASALQLTMKQLSDNPGHSFGCVYYNDEMPDGFGNGGSNFGHCKGIVAFDMRSDSAIWIMHSVPNFGAPGNSDFPTLLNGQTLLCITLKNVATAESIASQMLTQQGPQTYGAVLPAGVTDTWQKLVARQYTLSRTAGDLTFESLAGARFRCFAKSKAWDGVAGPDGMTFEKDLWSDLVGPSIHADLAVESWLRGPSFGDTDPDGETTTNVTSVDLAPLGIPYAWPSTKDHAKWAAAFKNEGNWVCISDINREITQGKRGGAAICFQNDKLWGGMSVIDRFGTRPQLIRAVRVREMGRSERAWPAAKVGSPFDLGPSFQGQDRRDPHDDWRVPAARSEIAFPKVARRASALSRICGIGPTRSVPRPSR
jgi:deoxyribonuclease-2